jgi:hypothetical protein
VAQEDDVEGGAYRDFGTSLSRQSSFTAGEQRINVRVFDNDDDDDDDDNDDGPSSPPPPIAPHHRRGSIEDEFGDGLGDGAHFAPPPEPDEDDDDPHHHAKALAVPAPRAAARSLEVFRNSPVSSVHAGATYRVAPEYYEITQLNDGSVARYWYARGAQLRPTERAWQMLANANDLANVTDCGATVLRLLDRFFIEKPGPFSYRGQTPSHEWDRSSPAAGGLPPKLLARLCLEVCELLIKEPALVRPAEPCYVLGDLHGNFRDLKIFARAFWPLGIDFTPASALFLGDYVDRGPHSVEVAAYVLALKLIAPGKVFLLRGNHEISQLNGNEKAYGLGCFRGQCKHAYGEKRGEKVWSAFNEAFRFLPVSAVIGERVFCVHGGIPRTVAPAITSGGGGAGRNNVLDAFAELPIHSSDSWTNPTVMDMLWADPATPADEETGLRARSGETDLDNFPDGFAPNKARGPFTCVFGRQVVDKFLAASGCTHIIRAHQPPRLGVDLQHQSKVITVFSSSHYCGAHNAAAAALVANRTIRVVLASIDQNTLMDGGGGENRAEKPKRNFNDDNNNK